MSMKLIALILSVVFTNYVASTQTSGCPLIPIGENWNATLKTCASQVVDEGGDEMRVKVVKLIEDLFASNNVSKVFPLTSAEISDAEKAASVRLLFCIVQSVVQQEPQVGVMGFDCTVQRLSQTHSSGDESGTEKQFHDCFMRKLKLACADELNSTKHRNIISALRRR